MARVSVQAGGSWASKPRTVLPSLLDYEMVEPSAWVGDDSDPIGFECRPISPEAVLAKLDGCTVIGVES